MPVAHGHENLKILIRSSAIRKRVIEVAHKITRDYKGERVHLIGVLKGACIFLSDLVREINLETSIDFMAVSSYGKKKARARSASSRIWRAALKAFTSSS